MYDAELKDRRVVQSRSGEGKAFAPVGFAISDSEVAANPEGTVKSKVGGTAVVISPCYVSVSYHVVFGESKIGLDTSSDHTVTFYVGDNNKGGFAHKVTARLDKSIDYSKFDPSTEDRVAMKMDKCAGLDPSIGWAESANESISSYKNQAITFVGYDGKSGNLMRSPACHVMEEILATSAIRHNCDTVEGNSGGVGFVTASDGAKKIVFINRGQMSVVTSDDPSGQRSKIFGHWDRGNSNLGIDYRSVLNSPDFEPVRRDLKSWNVVFAELPFANPPCKIWAGDKH